MARHNNIGKFGEQYAAQYLEHRLGYTVVATNWRHGKVELDIVARYGETLVFVEVKTRTSALHGAPETLISPRKQQLLTAAAMAYMQANHHEWAIRFDVAVVYWLPNTEPEMQYIEDAFFPGW